MQTRLWLDNERIGAGRNSTGGTIATLRLEGSTLLVRAFIGRLDRFGPHNAGLAELTFTFERGAMKGRTGKRQLEKLRAMRVDLNRYVDEALRAAGWTFLGDEGYDISPHPVYRAP